MQEKYSAPEENSGQPMLDAIRAAIETMGGQAKNEPLSPRGVSDRIDELVRSEDIHELLDKGLTDTGLGGAETIIFSIDDHPDLFARLNPGRTVESRRKAKHAADWLAGHNINMVPSEVVDHCGLPFVIVERIKGTPLDEVLAGNLSPELTQALDIHWKRLTEALVDARRNNKPWPLDVEGPNQCMVGSRPGENEVKVWITDFPYDVKVLDGLGGPDSYEQEVLFIIDALLEVERVAGIQLPEARQAVLRTLEHFQDSNTYGDGLAQGVRYALEHNVPILPYADDDDLIENLRTR
jgi:hypothetical protein